MNRSTETRLRKLEAASPDRKARFFVVQGTTEAERQAEIDALIASGEAKPSDCFIYTGVPRTPGSPYRCGPVADVLERVAKEGRRIHDPRD